MDATSKDMPWFEISSEGEICLKPEYRGENISSSYISDNGIKSKGSMFDKLPQKLVIPNSLDEVEVRSIREAAFLTSNLRSVVIGDNVIKIGDAAFASADINEISLGNSIEEIGKNAFCACKKLTDVSFPESLKIVGESSFAACDGLVTLKIPDNVETIGKTAFVSCVNLKSIKFGNSIKIIGTAAFASCDSLVNVQLPDSVEIIEESVFVACSNLKTVEIGKSESCQIQTIGTGAFLNCQLLESIIIYSNKSKFQSSNDWSPATTEIQWMLKDSRQDLSSENTTQLTTISTIPTISQENTNRPTYTQVQDTTSTNKEQTYKDAKNLYDKAMTLAKNGDSLNGIYLETLTNAYLAFEALGNYKDCLSWVIKIKELQAVVYDLNLASYYDYYSITQFEDISTSINEIAFKTQVSGNEGEIALTIKSKVDKSNFSAEIKNYSDDDYSLFRSILSVYIQNYNDVAVSEFLLDSRNWIKQSTGKYSAIIPINGYNIIINIEKLNRFDLFDYEYVNGTITGYKTS